MGLISDLGSTAWRKFVIDGVSASGFNKAKHEEILKFVFAVEAVLNSSANGILVGNAVVYQTRAALYADLAHPADRLGVVYNDSTAAYNGIYRKTGSSGSGSWVLTSLALPSTFIAEVYAAIAAVADDLGLQIDTVSSDLTTAIEAVAADLGSQIGLVGDSLDELQDLTRKRVLPQVGERGILGSSGWLRAFRMDNNGNVVAGIDKENNLRGRLRDHPGTAILNPDFRAFSATEDGYLIEAWDHDWVPVNLRNPGKSYPFSQIVGGIARLMMERNGVFFRVGDAAVDNFPLDVHGRLLRYAEYAGSSYSVKTEEVLCETSFSSSITSFRHLLLYGQSLEDGIFSVPVETSAAISPGKVLTPNGGPAVRGANDASIVTDPEALYSLVNAREIGRETPASNAGNEFAKRLSGSTGVVVSAHARGGTAYVSLRKGSQSYANLIEAARRVAFIGRANGLAESQPLVTWNQGQNNRTDSKSVYQGYIEELFTDLNVDIPPKTEISGTVVLLVGQMSNWTAYAMTTCDVPLAQLQAALDNAGIVCVGPQYFLETVVDGVHLTAGSSARWGAYEGRAAAAGSAWQPVHIVSAVRTGSSIELEFYTPSGDIVLDTTNILNPGNFGIEWFQAGGTARTITSVTKTAAKKLTVTLSGDPGSPSTEEIGVAITGTSGAAGGPTTGARSCIRDSSTDLDKQGRTMFNFACHQRINVN